MTDPGRRALNPGGGAILRRTYAKLLAVSVAGVVLAWIIALSVIAIAPGNTLLLVLAYVVLAIASVCLIASITRARAAIHDDEADSAGLRSATRLARAGSIAGWLGALVLVATGFVQYTRDVDNALQSGIVLAATAMIVGVGNDGTYRLTKRLVAR